ncbi:hypothetical protein OROHE_012737 [Orobanche hederae]
MSVMSRLPRVFKMDPDTLGVTHISSRIMKETSFLQKTPASPPSPTAREDALYSVSVFRIFPQLHAGVLYGKRIMNKPRVISSVPRDSKTLIYYTNPSISHGRMNS